MPKGFQFQLTALLSIAAFVKIDAHFSLRKADMNYESSWSRHVSDTYATMDKYIIVPGGLVTTHS